MNLFCCCACCALQDRSADFTYSFQCSVLEIYNEQLYDLLSDHPGTADSLAILDDPQGGTYVRHRGAYT